jgi:DNA (cytosine-5)-methyltransferase 1
VTGTRPHPFRTYSVDSLVMDPRYTSIEICAGAGGQALGLEQAGFDHLACVEWEAAAVETLRTNRPSWTVVHGDVRGWSYDGPAKVDLLAGGVPCPPYSIAGRQMGADDDRDLFPEVLRLAREIRPRAIMIENVKGLLSAKFEDYRNEILATLKRLGYRGEWQLMQASDFGVPQLRPRSILVALEPKDRKHFGWPTPTTDPTPTVGEVLLDSMRARGWEHAEAWAELAAVIAPTLVGGSKKHGGADLGPTRAKRQWATIGVNGLGVGDDVPGPGFVGSPKLTVKQAALLQGFPPEWKITGRKTAAYRQVGNAFPPPVAQAVGRQIIAAFIAADQVSAKQSE